MSSFAGRWLNFLVGAGALLLVTLFARGAWAFPGSSNINTGVPTQGLYITSENLDGGCPTCHGAPTKAEFAGGFTGVNPALSVTATGSSGSGTTALSVQPGVTTTITLTFNNNPAGGFLGAGGFFLRHNATTGGSGNSQGVLGSVGANGAVTASHACPDAGPSHNPNGTACGTVVNTNTEVMHESPAPGSTSTFQFTFTPPAGACSGTFPFELWINSEDGNSDCLAPDSAYQFLFTISIAACNDGNACTGGDFCSAGTCSHTTTVTCTASDQCHSVGTCNTSTGICSNPVKTGAACDDSNACTTGETCSAGGVCTGGTSTVCTASDQCHSAGTCNTSTGVCSNPVKTGAACNDSNACTTGETCSAGGVCTGGTATVCTASDQCHSAGTCNTSTGVCSNPALANNTACSDGNSCTNPDTCQSGVCQPGPGMVCTASDQCHGVGTCSGGVCSNPALPNNTACSDGNACTVGDTCQAGACQSGGPATIDDGNPCTADACTPAGGVTHTPILPVPVCHDGTRGPCDVVVMCTTGGVCPPLDVDHTSKQCSGPSCSNGPPSVETFAAVCDGTHTTCPTALTQDCAGAACSGNVCGGGCAGDDSKCVTGDFCNVNVCTPKLGTGQVCTGNSNCSTGFCADGFCCNSACGNSDPTDCQACNLTAAQGGTPGTCSVPVGSVCRAAVDVCDAAEKCVAGNTACPTDLPAPANTVCRASSDGNLCDPAEVCNGFNCPADNPTRDGQACTTDNNPCSQDICASNACTHNQPAGTSVPCRASRGVCDPAENCDAADTNCAPDIVFDATHVCRPVAVGETCDVAENCLGGANFGCPADGFDANTVSCGSASCAFGTATPAVNCPGANVSGTCPTPKLQACSPYLCAGTACGTTCSVKTDCATGFYCNPSHACVPELTAGTPCTTAESCGTGICVDGVCCNSQCTGQCQACDVAASPGVCSPITDKVPHGLRTKCTGDGSACQGVCDGVNTTSCALPGSTTQCRAPTCTNGIATLVASCQGNGTCPAVQTQSCAPGICQTASGPKAICLGGAGTTPCTSDVECQAGSYCSAGICKTKIPDGTACASDSQCANAHCVDNVCCNTACDGQCEACDVANAPGKCTAVTDAPHGGRPACNSDPQYPGCAGKCDGKNLLSCVFPGPGTSCRDASCTNDVATLPASCTGTGTCSPAQQQACVAPNGCNQAGTICDNGCTTDRDCAVNKYCSGGVCVPTLALGAPCSTSGQCAGACVDGVCCNTACDHQCEACNKEGICTPVTGAPVLPRQACATDGNAACVGACNGVNTDACTFPGSTKQCSAGSCASGVAQLTTFCDGAGSCPPAQNQICAPADCGATQCAGDCATAACAAGSYCSGGVCEPKLGQGAVCDADAQCANGQCTDGYCCSAACTGQCQACDVPGLEGTCTTITNDFPHGGRAACPGFGACGAICDGTSPTQCTYAPATTTCGKSSCGTNGDQLTAPLCNGVGACLPALDVNCGAYSCDAPSGACLTTCLLETDCASGFDCVASKCVPATPDAGMADSGVDGAAPPADASVADASEDGMAADGATPDGTAPDSGNAGAPGDAGTPLVPPNHSTDKGSCGCSVPGSETGNSGLFLLAGLALVGVTARRRRRGERDERI